MSLGDLGQPEASSRGMFVLKQSANIYTAMMILAFVFICIGCLFLFLEMKAYGLHVTVPADAKVPQATWMLPSHSAIVSAQPVPRIMEVPPV
ncbi:MAG TPA: hypothetical protein VFE46_11695 [Pirellulales bacterium]|jgi:hypothetical protein|nr:hypothetical protein [Pirellulales bacterium]